MTERALSDLQRDVSQDHERRLSFGTVAQQYDDQLEFRDNPEFTDVDARVYEWPQRYTADEYLALLGTHSDHMLLPGDAREQLFSAVAGAIDAAGGSFELIYQTMLGLARRAT